MTRFEAGEGGAPSEGGAPGEGGAPSGGGALQLPGVSAPAAP